MDGHAPVPYFPRSGSKDNVNILTQTLPERPTSIGPVCDAAHSKVPLPSFDESVHTQSFGGLSDEGEAIEPCRPAHFEEGYLFPYLTQNERLRLTMFWYHTRGIEQDDQFVAKIDALVKGLQQAIGWEYAMAGIMSEHTYTRLATANLPLAILPRRESTCSHTINQAPNSVLMVTDMSKDWRFQRSPPVEVGGIKAYAGTQLRLKADDGNEVALGALCVASTSPQPPLSQDQRDFLVRFAELISSLISSYARQRRLKERQRMSDMLSELQHMVGDEDYEASAIGFIQQAYPDAHISIQVATDNQLSVQDRPGISLSAVHHGLWEDTALIEQIITTSNFERLRSDQTVRAIVARCRSSDTFVVVASRDIQHVLDDFDSWFISEAASIIADTLQKRALQRALDARENFLRGITHQLRTPIHGILGAAELLAEEIAAGRSPDAPDAPVDRGMISTSPFACLATIKTSGQELIGTVNNILKHNHWVDGLRQSQPSPYDLNDLENDVMPGILSLVHPEHLRSLSIEFRNELDSAHCILQTDVQLLKDCLQAVVLNAVQSVSGSDAGSVTVTVRSIPDFTELLFDVVDNGCGIDPAHHDLIFRPYEKTDHNKPGAGLGLTLASQIARALNGSVELVSSTPGTGTNFEIAFRDPILSGSNASASTKAMDLEYLPRTFKAIRSDAGSNHFIDHTARYLERNGFQRESDDNLDVGIVLTNLYPADAASQIRIFSHHKAVVVRHVVDDYGFVPDIPGTVTISGPLHTQRLGQMLLQANRLRKDLLDNLIQQQTTTKECAEPEADAGETMSAPAPDIAALSLVGDGDYRNRSPRALLVDDNLVNLRILQMFCQKRKIPYITAMNGHEAVERFVKAAEDKDEEAITVVLMDLQMPHCDGIQATSAIRVYEQEHNRCRSAIFMVTGQDSEKDKSDSQRAGADEYLVKPVGPSVFDKFIRKYSAHI
ncbi:Uu.00g105510.m01.CDS01 [Anthostomella pinea]|uniref:histidine kinase n=1 Tax=Anthostomella pinea TaxID=933095 RepID=A0AAI8VEZ4_9PEZI|nr:Uu.00g105510.m01.CDS01 [Anthostomella pinea]